MHQIRNNTLATSPQQSQNKLRSLHANTPSLLSYEVEVEAKSKQQLVHNKQNLHLKKTDQNDKTATYEMVRNELLLLAKQPKSSSGLILSSKENSPSREMHKLLQQNKDKLQQRIQQKYSKKNNSKRLQQLDLGQQSPSQHNNSTQIERNPLQPQPQSNNSQQLHTSPNKFNHHQRKPQNINQLEEQILLQKLPQGAGYHRHYYHHDYSQHQHVDKDVQIGFRVGLRDLDDVDGNFCGDGVVQSPNFNGNTITGNNYQQQYQAQSADRISSSNSNNKFLKQQIMNDQEHDVNKPNFIKDKDNNYNESYNGYQIQGDISGFGNNNDDDYDNFNDYDDLNFPYSQSSGNDENNQFTATTKGWNKQQHCGCRNTTSKGKNGKKCNNHQQHHLRQKGKSNNSLNYRKSNNFLKMTTTSTSATPSTMTGTSSFAQPHTPSYQTSYNNSFRKSYHQNNIKQQAQSNNSSSCKYKNKNKSKKQNINKQNQQQDASATNDAYHYTGGNITEKDNRNNIVNKDQNKHQMSAIKLLKLQSEFLQQFDEDVDDNDDDGKQQQKEQEEGFVISLNARKAVVVVNSQEKEKVAKDQLKCGRLEKSRKHQDSKLQGQNHLKNKKNHSSSFLSISGCYQDTKKQDDQDGKLVTKNKINSLTAAHYHQREDQRRSCHNTVGSVVAGPIEGEENSFGRMRVSNSNIMALQMNTANTQTTINIDDLNHQSHQNHELDSSAIRNNKKQSPQKEQRENSANSHPHPKQKKRWQRFPTGIDKQQHNHTCFQQNVYGGSDKNGQQLRLYYNGLLQREAMLFEPEFGYAPRRPKTWNKSQSLAAEKGAHHVYYKKKKAAAVGDKDTTEPKPSTQKQCGGHKGVGNRCGSKYRHATSMSMSASMQGNGHHYYDNILNCPNSNKPALLIVEGQKHHHKYMAGMSSSSGFGKELNNRDHQPGQQGHSNPNCSRSMILATQTATIISSSATPSLMVSKTTTTKTNKKQATNSKFISGYGSGAAVGIIPSSSSHSKNRANTAGSSCVVHGNNLKQTRQYFRRKPQSHQHIQQQQLQQRQQQCLIRVKGQIQMERATGKEKLMGRGRGNSYKISQQQQDSHDNNYEKLQQHQQDKEQQQSTSHHYPHFKRLSSAAPTVNAQKINLHLQNYVWNQPKKAVLSQSIKANLLHQLQHHQEQKNQHLDLNAQSIKKYSATTPATVYQFFNVNDATNNNNGLHNKNSSAKQHNSVHKKSKSKSKAHSILQEKKSKMEKLSRKKLSLGVGVYENCGNYSRGNNKQNQLQEEADRIKSNQHVSSSVTHQTTSFLLKSSPYVLCETDLNICDNRKRNKSFDFITSNAVNEAGLAVAGEVQMLSPSCEQKYNIQRNNQTQKCGNRDIGKVVDDKVGLIEYDNSDSHDGEANNSSYSISLPGQKLKSARKISKQKATAFKASITTGNIALSNKKRQHKAIKNTRKSHLNNNSYLEQAVAEIANQEAMGAGAIAVGVGYKSNIGSGMPIRQEQQSLLGERNFNTVFVATGGNVTTPAKGSSSNTFQITLNNKNQKTNKSGVKKHNGGPILASDSNTLKKTFQRIKRGYSCPDKCKTKTKYYSCEKDLQASQSAQSKLRMLKTMVTQPYSQQDVSISNQASKKNYKHQLQLLQHQNLQIDNLMITQLKGRSITKMRKYLVTATNDSLAEKGKDY